LFSETFYGKREISKFIGSHGCNSFKVRDNAFSYLMNLLCSTYGGDETYRVLVGKPEGKIPLGRHGRRWEDDIQIDIQEVGWANMNRMDLAQNRNMRRASGTIPCREILDYLNTY
jgi:hypothetical protein